MQLRSGKIVNSSNEAIQNQAYLNDKNELVNLIKEQFAELDEIRSDNEKYYRCEVGIERAKKAMEVFKILSEDKHQHTIQHDEFSRFRRIALTKCREFQVEASTTILELRNFWTTRYLNNQIKPEYWTTKMQYYAEIECMCHSTLQHFEEIYR